MTTYELFTYPACQKCEDLKAFLKTTDLKGQEFSLVGKEGKQKVRDYLSRLRRDDKGSLILPILVLRDETGVRAVFQSLEEARSWWKSKG